MSTRTHFVDVFKQVNKTKHMCCRCLTPSSRAPPRRPRRGPAAELQAAQPPRLRLGARGWNTGPRGPVDHSLRQSPINYMLSSPSAYRSQRVRAPFCQMPQELAAVPRTRWAWACRAAGRSSSRSPRPRRRSVYVAHVFGPRMREASQEIKGWQPVRLPAGKLSMERGNRVLDLTACPPRFVRATLNRYRTRLFGIIGLQSLHTSS